MSEAKPRSDNQLNHRGWIDYFPINNSWTLVIPIICQTLPMPLIIQKLVARSRLMVTGEGYAWLYPTTKDSWIINPYIYCCSLMLQIIFIQFYAIKRIRYFIWVNIQHFIVKILFLFIAARYLIADKTSYGVVIDLLGAPVGELPGIAIGCFFKQ